MDGVVKLGDGWNPESPLADREFQKIVIGVLVHKLGGYVRITQADVDVMQTRVLMDRTVAAPGDTAEFEMALVSLDEARAQIEKQNLRQKPN